MTRVSEVFEALGREVRRAWAGAHFDVAALPEIAVAALRRARLSQRVGFDDVVDHVFSAAALPRAQQDPLATFGQPPVTLYGDDVLEVQALVWFDGSTTIHEHAFAGAFEHLAGSSVHARFAFDSGSPPAAPLRLGHLGLEELSLLQPGEPRPILPGSGTIHAVYHLGQPSVSVVVRSRSSVAGRQQLNYYTPGLALAPVRDAPERLRRRAQLAASLARNDPERLAAAWQRAVAAGLGAEPTLYGWVLQVAEALLVCPAPELLTPALDALCDALGEPMGQALRCVRLEGERRRVGSLRGLVKRAEGRALLGGLVFAARRDDVLGLLAACAPAGAPAGAPKDAPAERLQRGLRALLAEPAAQATLLGASGFVLDEAGWWILDRVCAGATEAELLAAVGAAGVPAGVNAERVVHFCFGVAHTSRLGVLLAG